MIPAGVIYCRLRLWRLRRLPFVSRRLQRGDGVKRNFKPPKVDEKRSRCHFFAVSICSWMLRLSCNSALPHQRRDLGESGSSSRCGLRYDFDGVAG
jgi:hypothetical protein